MLLFHLVSFLLLSYFVFVPTFLRNQIVKVDNDNANTDAANKVKTAEDKLNKLREATKEFAAGFAQTMGMSSQVVEDFIINSLDQFSDKVTSIEYRIKSTYMFLKELTHSVYQQRVDEIQHEIDLTQEKNDRELEIS